MRISKKSIISMTSLFFIILLSGCDNKSNTAASSSEYKSAQEAAAEVSKSIQASQGNTSNTRQSMSSSATAGGQVKSNSKQPVSDTGIVGIPKPDHVADQVADTVKSAVTATKEAAEQAAGKVSNVGEMAVEKTKSMFSDEEKSKQSTGSSQTGSMSKSSDTSSSNTTNMGGSTSAQQAAAKAGDSSDTSSKGANNSASMNNASQNQSASSGEIAGLPKGATDTVDKAATATQEAVGKVTDKVAAAGESMVDKAKSALSGDEKKKKCSPGQAAMHKSSGSNGSSMPTQQQAEKASNQMGQSKQPSDHIPDMSSKTEPSSANPSQKEVASGTEIAGIPKVGTETIKNAVSATKEAAENAVSKAEGVVDKLASQK